MCVIIRKHIAMLYVASSRLVVTNVSKEKADEMLNSFS